MEWRCEWCGKPHEDDDPPCDSCGHGSFERAVVRQPEPIDTGTSYEWICANCGRSHVRNTPPCSRCGCPDLERAELDYENLEADITVSSYRELVKPYLPIIGAFVIIAVLVATGVVSVPSF